MTRVTDRQSTKAAWRRGERKQYGIQAVKNFRTKSNTKKQKKQ